MTRREVARRLGKSIAAVRRLEGVLLTPKRDPRGVHQFDESEVEALAESVKRGEVSIWDELQLAPGSTSGPSEDCPTCRDLNSKLAVLERQLEEQRQRSKRELDAVKTELVHERTQIATERRAIDRELRELIAVIESG